MVNNQPNTHKGKEEILKSIIDNHSWGYSYDNIAAVDGTMNDFLNIALSAMEQYKRQGTQSQPVPEEAKERVYESNSNPPHCKKHPEYLKNYCPKCSNIK